MAEGSESHSSPLDASGCRVPVRAATESLGCGPHRLSAVKAQDVESVFECLDAGLNIPHLPLTVVATTVTEVRGTLCIPHRRPCCIDTNRISILQNNISSLDVRREVVVLAIQNDRDRMISINLVN